MSGKEEVGDSGCSKSVSLSLLAPAPPANLSLGFAVQPPVLRASWSFPPGGRDGFRLRLYSLKPLALDSEETLGPEIQNFSWAQLPRGSEILVRLATLRGLEESGSANATGWTRECPLHGSPLPLPFIMTLTLGLPSSNGATNGGQSCRKLGRAGLSLPKPQCPCLERRLWLRGHQDSGTQSWAQGLSRAGPHICLLGHVKCFNSSLTAEAGKRSMARLSCCLAQL